MGMKDTPAAAACGVWLATCARFKVKLGLSHSPLKLNPEMALQLPLDAKATTKRKTRECVSKRKLQMALKTCSAGERGQQRNFAQLSKAAEAVPAKGTQSKRVSKLN